MEATECGKKLNARPFIQTKWRNTFQDTKVHWRLVGMRFPEGDSELVLKNNSDLPFTEIEILVDDVLKTYESLKGNAEVE